MKKSSIITFLLLVILLTGRIEAAPTAAGRQQTPSPSSGAVITRDQLTQAIQTAVTTSLADPTVTIEVHLQTPSDSIRVAQALTSVTAEPAQQGDALGRRFFKIHLGHQEGPPTFLTAIADIDAFLNVPVPTRAIKVNEILAEEDLTHLRVKLTTLTTDWSRQRDQLIGKRVLRPLRAEAPILPSAIGLPYVIKKGDRITVEAVRGGMRLQLTGIAKTNGAIGDTIAVKNPESGKEIQAVVREPGLAHVRF